MPYSKPKIPPFGIEEPSLVFALWLRDELRSRPSETKREIAHIAAVADDTIANWAKGSSAPGLNRAVHILWYLKGWSTYFRRLDPSRDDLVALFEEVKLSPQDVASMLALHPSAAALDDALDEAMARHHELGECIQAIRAAQRRRERHAPGPTDEDTAPVERLVPRRA